jgi:dTDP-4-dehydrorhamnose reductase
VDGCEDDKNLGEDGEAWRINVLGASNVAEYCRDLGKKIIYISTDFVFDGEKEKGEFYTEKDSPNPINWYSKTKYEGEKLIEKSGAPYMILRLAYPYRANFEPKKDFLRAILDNLKNGNQVKAITDHVFCPTFIDDFAFALEKLVKNDASGIFHTVGGQALTPFEATKIIASEFNLDTNLIVPITREEFFKDRAPRPFNLALRNARIGELGVEMKGFEEGLISIKSQMQPL